MRYAPDVAAVVHPARHLRHFSGIVQANGYAGFNPRYAIGCVIEAACWAHVRRKFYDIAQQQTSPLALETIFPDRATLRYRRLRCVANQHRSGSAFARPELTPC
ncbi:MAG TPA: transposase [Bordetella sp.]|uniref:IS66 family transposase n=1 Tax=Bordetella sp. TaxID=28081 RepID=UPI002ED275EF